MPSKIADFYRRAIDTSPDNARRAVASLDPGAALWSEDDGAGAQRWRRGLGRARGGGAVPWPTRALRRSG